MSPTIHREAGYLFYFVSFDIAAGEPPHVHAGKGSHQPGSDAKIWLDPVQVAQAGRFSRAELRRMQAIVAAQREEFLQEWYEYADRL